jgi:mono/diheme cytochrome c family protein
MRWVDSRWTLCCALLVSISSTTAMAQTAPTHNGTIRRGQYLSNLGDCNGCHSPKISTSHGLEPDPARMLSGHPATEPLPAVPVDAIGPGKWLAMASDDLTAWAGPWGISFAANLTPDAETGLGRWTSTQFIQTMRTGRHLGVGRPVLPPMPTEELAAMSDADLRALFSYLQSLKPVRNLVPAPVPPKS